MRIYNPSRNHAWLYGWLIITLAGLQVNAVDLDISSTGKCLFVLDLRQRSSVNSGFNR